MNINKLIKKIKDQIGMTRYLKTSYNDQAIYDIIVTHALKDWSMFFKYEYDPGIVEFDIDSAATGGSDLLALPQYIIKAVKRSNLQIEDIRKINWTNQIEPAARGPYTMQTVYQGYMNVDSLMAGNILAQRQGDMDDFTNYRYSCWFEKPNSLRFNYPIASLTSNGYTTNNSVLKRANMSMYLSQAPNLLGVSPAREYYFFELCKLHVMKIIYENETKYMESISTGVGQLNLKVDEWSQAGERLRELLKELEGYSTLSQHIGWKI